MNSEFIGSVMLGTFVNTFAIIVGSLIGLIFSRFIPTKITNTLIHGVAFAVMLIGLKMAWKEDNFIILICSLAIGGVMGELIRIEDRINGFGKWLGERFSKPGSSISKGFVTTTLLYCVGSMALVGSLESGLTGNHDTLFAKSVLDGLGSIIFSASLGIGVLFSNEDSTVMKRTVRFVPSSRRSWNFCLTIWFSIYTIRPARLGNCIRPGTMIDRNTVPDCRSHSCENFLTYGFELRSLKTTCPALGGGLRKRSVYGWKQDMKERQESINRLTSAFERLVNVLSTGKKRARDYGTGELIFTAEAHHISIIGRNPGITAREIVQKMGITKGAVSQVLRKLEEKDYIIKYPKPDNLREFCLNLTKKGQMAFKAHESNDQKLVESLSKHLESLNPEQIEKVADMVSELSDYLKNSETI